MTEDTKPTRSLRSIRRHLLAGAVIALVLVGLLLCAGTAAARDFSVRLLSDPQGNARQPTLSETGLVAWQGYTPYDSTAPLAARPDVLSSPPTTVRSDIYVWKDGQIQNVTGDDARERHPMSPTILRTGNSADAADARNV